MYSGILTTENGLMKPSRVNFTKRRHVVFSDGKCNPLSCEVENSDTGIHP